MDISWSIIALPTGYVFLTDWGLTTFLGNNKEGLKTEEQKVKFQIPIYIPRWWLVTTSENWKGTYTLRLRGIVYKTMNFCAWTEYFLNAISFTDLIPGCEYMLVSFLQIRDKEISTIRNRAKYGSVGTHSSGSAVQGR